MERDVVEVEHSIPWVVDPSPNGRGHTVAELLPDGYERYLRLFHPFVPWSAEPHLGPAKRRVRWGEVAARAGIALRATTTLGTLGPGLDDDEPERLAVWEGDLEAQAAADLYGTLGQDESGPVFFEFGLAAAIATDDHRERLFRAMSVGGRHRAVERVRALGATVITTPSLGWSHDLRWIVCSDYDLTSTYIATDRPTAERLLGHPDLEILLVERTTRVDDAADGYLHENLGG
ncbi:MAG: hypothetical protein KF906_10285 [Actinobacteria bacterium]|nr:hypothetical protein [Actinomycetota bacterium]